MRPGVWGIDTTTDPRAFAYASGRTLLVVVFQRLFNGQSFFGISGSAGRAHVRSGPGTVIIDDAHTCLAKAEQEFRLTVPSSEAAYGKILELFADVAGEQSPPGSWTYVPSGSGPCSRSRSGRGLTASARRPAPARRPGAIHVLLAAAG